MVEIAFRNGQPILRDGKVATGGGCCPCLSLTLFPVVFYSEANPSIAQDNYDDVKPWVDALQANLEAAGWSVERSDSVYIGNAPPLPGNPTLVDAVIITLSATCECCISNVSDCAAYLENQPDGLWVQVRPNDVIVGATLYAGGPLYLRPLCIGGQDCYAPESVNGVGFAGSYLNGFYVPSCDPAAEHCNPLP